MVSPTPNKGYTYPAHGGAVNAWDTPINTDIDTIDTNLGGTVSFSLAAGSVVLSASQAQNLSYTLTGLLVGNVTVTWPAVGGFYIVDNQTTGAFTVTLLSVGGGTTVLAPQGFVTFIWANSAAPNDMKPVMTSVTGALNITGAATIGGVLTLSVTSYMQLPNGTTGQRPGSPTAGFLRYNSTLGVMEYGDGTSWNSISAAQPIAAGFKNLSIANNSGTPNSIIDLSADAVTLENSSGTALRVRTVAVSINSGVVGANGIDAGAIGASTWYAIYVIYNPTTATTAGLISLSATAPTLPAGYTYYARFGWQRTDSSNRFLRILQKGRTAQYVVSSAITTLPPVIDNGVVGTFSVTSPTLSAVSVTSFVPTTASRICIIAYNVWKGSAAGGVIVAPNTSYGGANNGPQGSNGVLHPYSTISTMSVSNAFWMVLEATTIAWCSAAAGGAIACLGWEDQLT